MEIPKIIEATSIPFIFVYFKPYHKSLLPKQKSTSITHQCVVISICKLGMNHCSISQLKMTDESQVCIQIHGSVWRLCLEVHLYWGLSLLSHTCKFFSPTTQPHQSGPGGSFWFKLLVTLEILPQATLTPSVHQPAWSWLLKLYCFPSILTLICHLTLSRSKRRRLQTSVTVRHGLQQSTPWYLADNFWAVLFCYWSYLGYILFN